MKIQTKFAVCHTSRKGKGLVGLIGLQLRPPAKADELYMCFYKNASKNQRKTPVFTDVFYRATSPRSFS